MGKDAGIQDSNEGRAAPARAMGPGDFEAHQAVQVGLLPKIIRIVRHPQGAVNIVGLHILGTRPKKRLGPSLFLPGGEL